MYGKSTISGFTWPGCGRDRRRPELPCSGGALRKVVAESPAPSWWLFEGMVTCPGACPWTRWPAISTGAFPPSFECGLTWL
jgi:hypothetical protein